MTVSHDYLSSKPFQGEIGVVLGTGPSLAEVTNLDGLRVFGINNTYRDFELDVWTACDPQWWDVYGWETRYIEADRWHWDEDIAQRYGAWYIEGRWCDGLSLDPSYIHYGHSSGYQALNLAVHYGCNPILLVGYDMRYNGQRHYFKDLSDMPGEYPVQLRKWSTFEGLIQCYETISKQQGLPAIINCTPGSALQCFPFDELSNFCRQS